MVKLKKIRVEDALGLRLLHDLTGADINDASKKITIFKRNHVVREEDINILKMNGKSHIYSLDSDIESVYHEEAAALLMAKKVIGKNVVLSDVNEGKINILAKSDGFSKINENELFNVNMNDGISFGTIKSNCLVKEGDVLASFRIIDLFYDKRAFDEILDNIKTPIIDVEPIVSHKIALLSVGSEIYNGLKEDLSFDKLSNKLENYQQVINEHKICDDNIEQISNTLKSSLIDNDIVLLVGGMSVDADDVSADVIRECADKVVSYGTPVIPGSMLMIAYYQDKVIMGLPANVIFSKKTVFDKIIPLILQNKILEKKDIAQLGYGGIELR